MKFIFSLITLVISLNTFSQAPKSYTSSEILLKLKKLNVLGNVLYVAAHPDDENTRMITYLANHRLFNTAYLSMTRGDGGQNLIGPEIRELLGIIRTQELLSARRRDGGFQFFTRANDFGYSKSAEETLKIWDKEQVLSDVVWTIRKFRPDVIITRFPPTRRAGHGQHESSAILAEEAFDIAGDASKYPEQINLVEPWQPKRLLLNTGRWWSNDINADDPGISTVDVGAYNPLLGNSYTEIASESRSQHKSQGFGSVSSRGIELEYLESKKGDPAETDLFEGIDTSWNRVKGGAGIAKMVNELLAGFDPTYPYKSMKPLLDLRNEVSKLKDPIWREIKVAEIDEIIKAITGLFIEVRTDTYSYTHGDSIKTSLEIVNRSPVKLTLVDVTFKELGQSITLNKEITGNEEIMEDFKTILPKGIEYSQPYWLRDEGSLGMYSVQNRELIGKPENDPALMAYFKFTVNNQPLNYAIPFVYRWRDPVKGEQYRPVEITPPVFLNLDQPVYMFADDTPKQVSVLVKAGKDNLQGNVTLNVPDSWSVIPPSKQISLEKKGEESRLIFMLSPSKNQESVEIIASATIEEGTYNNSLVRISYDHIPIQTLFSKASATAVKLDIEVRGKQIGYIMGAGDAVPESLEQIGYTVQLLQDEDINADNLKNLDAVILGIRALNTNDRIPFQMPLLFDYVKEGGNLIIQYNTSRRLKTNNFSPYEIKLSRLRVAEEDAEIRILAPDHPVLNTPNKISAKDFDNWVQERGLYFPEEWAKEFTAILSSNDTGEDPKDGGLLVAKYGEGYYIYSGYSWFRELPAGVPGAFRLFANMISLGNNENPNNLKLGRKEK